MTAVNDATAVVMHDDDIRSVLANVLCETQAQVGKWGIQHHPDGTGSDLQKALAQAAKDKTDAAAAAGTVTWKDILHEEVFEAYAESDPKRLVEELLQVAAVAVSWAVDVQGRS